MVQRDSFRDGTNQSRPGLSNKKNVHRRRERATASPSSTNDISTRIYRAHTASHKTGDKRGTAYDGLVSTTLFLQSDKQRLVCVPFASRLRGIYATPTQPVLTNRYHLIQFTEVDLARSLRCETCDCSLAVPNGSDNQKSKNPQSRDLSPRDDRRPPKGICHRYWSKLPGAWSSLQNGSVHAVEMGELFRSSSKTTSARVFVVFCLVACCHLLFSIGLRNYSCGAKSTLFSVSEHSSQVSSYRSCP